MMLKRLLTAQIILTIIFFLPGLSSFSQTVKFTKGNYHRDGKKSFHHVYYVNGERFQTNRRRYSCYCGSGFDVKFRYNYYIGYDSLVHEDAALYYNKPYFNDPDDTTLIGNTTGEIFYLTDRYCDYQYLANKANGQPVVARQCVSAKNVKKYNLKAGSKFKVQYLKSYPEAAIIYIDEPVQDSLPVLTKPFLSKPNGWVFNPEMKWLFLNTNNINKYLEENGQAALTNSKPLFLLNVNRYYKSGLWFGGGLGGGANIFTGNVGGGYLQKISRQYYLNFSVHFSGFEYTMNSFINDELKAIADTSQFTFTNYCINPRIDLMRREVKNNVWGCEFLSVGIGLMIVPEKNNKWSYEIGHDAVDGKGNHYTQYDWVQTLYNFPSFSGQLIYLSISYSFFSFSKQ